MSDPDFLITLNAIQALGLGCGLGAVGQGARVIVGLKKTHDVAAAKEETFAQNFKGAELLVSLFIGGIAGTFATIPFLAESMNITQQSILMLLAAGYAGADFIEGFISKSLPTVDPSAAAKTFLATEDTAGAQTIEAQPIPRSLHATTTSPESNITS